MPFVSCIDYSAVKRKIFLDEFWKKVVIALLTYSRHYENKIKCRVEVRTHEI
jgi:hypothetical protein